jgi:hypothetical protein
MNAEALKAWIAPGHQGHLRATFFDRNGAINFSLTIGLMGRVICG